MRRGIWTVLLSVLMLALVAPVAVQAAAPTISGFNPTSGPIGTSVTISGTNLSGATAVKFNGTSATITLNNATTIKANVPAGASTGKITVTTPGGTATSSGTFTVKLGILVSKPAAPPKATVNVSGSGFTVNGAVDLYFDATDLALVIADSKGTFVNAQLTVPSTALPGTHWISAVNRANSTGAQKSLIVRTNWAQFHNGSQRRGRNTTENVISPSTVSGLEVAWTSAQTPGVMYSSPAVVDGVVYVGTFDGKLNAYPVGCATGAGSCSPLWIGAAGTSIQQSSPAVADGVVYVGSIDGRLYAFAVGCNTGGGPCTPIWTGQAGAVGIQGSPTVVNGVVYISSLNHNLYAFAVGCNTGGGTCAPIWNGPTGDILFGSPAVANGVVYVGSSDDKLYAFAVGCNTGAERALRSGPA